MPYCLYLRKSRADKDFETTNIEDTLARHEKTLLDLAKKKSLSITAIYKEVASGESIEARPEMQKLLKEVESGLWEGVFVMEVERLARGNTKDQGVVAEAFQLSNTKIITPTKTYDPNNEFDEEYFEFGLFMSRREYKAINRRIQRGRVASAKEGKFLGSVPPFGYDKVKIKGEKGYTLKPNSNADIVKLIFDLYVNGKKMSDNTVKPLGHSLIAKELDAIGVKPLVSEKWSKASIKTIITNPAYIGKIRWSWDKEVKLIENGTVKKTRQRNDDCILVDGLHQGIIEEDLFYKAQEILTAKNIYPIASNKILKNPLSGIIYCGKCGGLMTRTNRRTRNKSIKEFAISCPNIYCDNISAPIEIIEKAILSSAKRWLDEYSVKWKLVQEQENKNLTSVKQKLIKKNNDELALINKQIDNTFDLLEQGIYDVDKFTERNALLANKKEAIEKNLKSLNEEIEKDLNKQKINYEYIPNMKKFIEVYPFLDNATDKNILLKSVFEKITYTKTEKSAKNKGNTPTFQLKLSPKIPK